MTRCPRMSESGRRLEWSSARCPPDLARRHGSDREQSPARLLRHLVVRRIDVEAPDSTDFARARAWCEAALVAAQADRADELLGAVLALVERTRTVGVLLSFSVLASTRPPLLLRARRDAEAAWAPLAEATQRALAGVRDTRVPALRMPRLRRRSLVPLTVPTALAYTCAKRTRARRPQPSVQVPSDDVTGVVDRDLASRVMVDPGPDRVLASDSFVSWLVSLPDPPGMIWRYPSAPSLNTLLHTIA